MRGVRRHVCFREARAEDKAKLEGRREHTWAPDTEISGSYVGA